MGKRKSQPSSNGDDVYIVETICKKKIKNNKDVLYLIKWKDWDDKFNTWEPSCNILDKSLIEQFEEEQNAMEEEFHKKVALEPVKPTEELALETGEGKRKTATSPVITKTKANKESEKDNNNEENGCPTRPKICLKISKLRIDQSGDAMATKPHSLPTTKDKDAFSYRIEKLRDETSGRNHTTKFHRSISESSLKDTENKLNRYNHHDNKSTKPLKRLLSINELSGIRKMKTSDLHHNSEHYRHHHHHHHHHHKKHRSHSKLTDQSEPQKHQLKVKRSKLKPDSHPSDKSTNHKPRDSIFQTITQEFQIDSLANQNEPIKSLEQDTLSPVSHTSPLNTKENVTGKRSIKLERPTKQQQTMYQYLKNAIVSDVKVDGLAVTIREFVQPDSDQVRTSKYTVDSDGDESYCCCCACSKDSAFQLVTIPRNSKGDWLQRIESKVIQKSEQQNTEKFDDSQKVQTIEADIISSNINNNESNNIDTKPVTIEEDEEDESELDVVGDYDWSTDLSNQLKEPIKPPSNDEEDETNNVIPTSNPTLLLKSIIETCTSIMIPSVASSKSLLSSPSNLWLKSLGNPNSINSYQHNHDSIVTKTTDSNNNDVGNMVSILYQRSNINNNGYYDNDSDNNSDENLPIDLSVK